MRRRHADRVSPHSKVSELFEISRVRTGRIIVWFRRCRISFLSALGLYGIGGVGAGIERCSVLIAAPEEDAMWRAMCVGARAPPEGELSRSEAQ